jgi:hypothetical protein
MKHNLIKTDNYLLVVDDSKIILGDYYIDDYLLLRKCVVDDSEYWSNRKDYKKIISHAPLNGAPYLDGVDRLPPNWRAGGEDVYKLVKERVLETVGNHNINSSTAKDMIQIGIDCYNKAREKYKFTEEDILDAWELGAKEGLPLTRKKKEDLFDSLHQPKLPIAFYSEDEYVHDDTVPYPKTLGTQLKTVVNSEGRIEWVGKYIYE